MEKVEKRLLTKSETLTYLNISRPVLDELIKNGVIKNVPLISAHRFDKVDLDNLITTLKENPNEKEIKVYNFK